MHNHNDDRTIYRNENGSVSLFLTTRKFSIGYSIKIFLTS